MCHRLSSWTFRFCSVANALALPPKELQFYLWAEFPQTPTFGFESHTPTRQPTCKRAFAENKHTHKKHSFLEQEKYGIHFCCCCCCNSILKDNRNNKTKNKSNKTEAKTNNYTSTK
jgi:hypothetical protein